MRARSFFVCMFFSALAAFAATPEARRTRVLKDIAAMDARRAAEQAALKDGCSLADYAHLVRSVDGTNVWTDALRAAVREHEVVRLPPGTYWMDGTVTLPSNRRLEAAGATVRLLPPTDTVLLRNAHAQDGTRAPVDAAARDANIAVVGGRWEDWSARRAGYGRTGRYNDGPRQAGTNFYGVSALFYFGNVRGVTLQGVTFARVGSFAFQAGDVEDLLCDDIRFDGCFADGLHVNGGCRNVHVRNVRGAVGDDLVALNVYDWQNSSVNFGPMDTVLCEDVVFTTGYPAFRIEPGVYTYADGSTVDCALRNAVIRRVKGIRTYKLYLQTPRYAVDAVPERGAPGSGENIWFEDIDIDLDRPVDAFPAYMDGDPLRGHFAAFEIGANLHDVHFRDIRLTMHADRFPLAHLVCVGPKSILVPAGAGKPPFEIFDPYVSCHVGEITIEGLQVAGELREAVHCTSFRDVNGDGRSTGAGSVGDVRADDPVIAYRAPPRRAQTGVWWHWMGCNVSRDGIVRDLDWFQDMGIGAATIFGMADVCSPWATSIPNSPTRGLVAFTPDWWKLVRFACEEAEKRGIELGLHNCPGYTSTGGPWIPPRLAMRELVFNVTNAEEQIALAAHAAFPVQVGADGPFKKPDVAARRADLREIAVVNGVRVQHIPMGAFTQPNQWETFGLECDKMNPEAVAYHLDHVIGELRRYVGDQVGRGLRFILLDSYEAGTPTWTPRMREEFTARRGYDPLRFLPVLGGFTNGYAQAEIVKFKKDFDRTRKDLYRDVLFKTMHGKLSAAGLEFACEPYGGPFDSRACAAYVDRVMTEFWFRPGRDFKPLRALGWDQWTRADGSRHGVVEAEAFTGAPENCRWNETPALLKAVGDQQYARGVNRFMLHTCPLQPWGDDVRPGAVMGRWGTHFGRTQTWARSGKGWIDYNNRCQAMLQWGEPSGHRIVGNDITPRGTFVTAHARASGGNVSFFVVNHGGHPVTLNVGYPDIGRQPEWFDPVTGRIYALARDAKGRAPIRLDANGSGFLVLRLPEGTSPPSPDADRVQQAPGPARRAVPGPWRVSFPAQGRNGAFTAAFPLLADWTASADARVKYFSGTATYRTTFDAGDAADARVLALGDCNGQIARVRLNGRDLGTAWCAPWEVAVPAGALKATDNALEVEFTNVWANRLIGDEQEPADCAFAKAPYPGGAYLARFPDWFVKKAPRPSSGRACFTTWNYFAKDDPLVPSGLLGPVTLR